MRLRKQRISTHRFFLAPHSHPVMVQDSTAASEEKRPKRNLCTERGSHKAVLPSDKPLSTLHRWCWAWCWAQNRARTNKIPDSTLQVSGNSFHLLQKIRAVFIAVVPISIVQIL